MKSSTVMGTPIRHIGASGGEGQMAGKPGGMSGTVNRQFEGDQKGNRELGIASGTPYNSVNGNPPGAKRVRSSSKYGPVMDSLAGNQADHLNNGTGVLFDGPSDATGMRPSNQPPTMDSPVPMGAQAPVPNAPRIKANLCSGIGDYWTGNTGPKDAIIENNGVMSRGMESTSTTAGGEFELEEDDLLKNLGAGGSVG